MRSCPFTFLDFQVEQLVSEGAGGEYYRARKPSEGPLGHQYLLFVAHETISADVNVRDRLRAFSDRCYGSTHANLFSALGIYHEANAMGVASEWLPGLPLSTLMAKLQLPLARWPVAEAIFLASELAKALNSLHSFRNPATGQVEGLVHGQLRPGNIFVTFGGQVKLAHPCVAEIESVALAARGSYRPDAANYASPEQSLGRELDGRSDCYSLGVLLWELISGKPLYPPSGRDEWMKALSEKVPAAPSQANKEVPLELDTVMRKLLDADLFKRYETSEATALDLDKVLKFQFPEFSAGDFFDFCAKQMKPLRASEEATKVDQVSEEVTKAMAAPVPSEAGPVIELATQRTEISSPDITPPPVRAPGPGAPRREVTKDIVLGENSLLRTSRTAQMRARVNELNEAEQDEGDNGWFFQKGFLKTAVTVGGLLLVLSPIFGSKALHKLRGGKGADKARVTASSPKGASLRFTSDQSGFEVMVNGQPVANLDEKFDVPVGEMLDIRVNKAGYDEIRFERALAAGETMDIPINFAGLQTYGTLSIQADPTSTVRVVQDNTVVMKNEGPIGGTRLPTGRYLVEAENPAIGFSQSEEVVLEPGMLVKRDLTRKLKR